jgi:hypothetical protein
LKGPDEHEDYSAARDFDGTRARNEMDTEATGGSGGHNGVATIASRW